jgi:fructose-1,6-bisphosphatase/inositol monophosphatase family enzyme
MIENKETIDEFLAHRSADVEEAVRKAAAAEIMPRFRRLADHEVDQKSGPHDLVTDADRLTERYLTEVLGALLPGSVVVGEEAVHADPATYGAICGTRRCGSSTRSTGPASSCTETPASAR